MFAQDLKQHSYSGLDETSRVRKLVKGIKTDKLDSVKTPIMLDHPNIMKDFDPATMFTSLCSVPPLPARLSVWKRASKEAMAAMEAGSQ
jgi:hypothetical protein